MRALPRPAGPAPATLFRSILGFDGVVCFLSPFDPFIQTFGFMRDRLVDTSYFLCLASIGWVSLVVVNRFY